MDKKLFTIKQKSVIIIHISQNVDENSTLSGDFRENCRVINTELKAVYSSDLGRPSLSGFNTARKPTLQVNEVVL